MAQLSLILLAIVAFIGLYVIFGSFFTVNTAEVAVITRFGKFLRIAEAGAIVGVRDIDQVMIGLAEIGDGDVTGVEHEFVGAAQSGQDVLCVAVAKPAIEAVGIIVSGEIVAELRAEQVIDIRQRVCTRPAGILSSGNVEADCYS